MKIRYHHYLKLSLNQLTWGKLNMGGRMGQKWPKKIGCVSGLLADSGLCCLNQLIYLAGGFYALQSRISLKPFSESLKHVLQPCEGFVEWFCNLIQNPLSAL